MLLTGTETLLGPIAASPLDMEPISTGVGSPQLSTDDDGLTLLFIPVFSRRWGLWSLVKGAAVVGACVVALLALRRCLRPRRAVTTAAKHTQTEPVSPTPLRKGKWTIVPSSPGPVSPVVEEKSGDTQLLIPLKEDPPQREQSPTDTPHAASLQTSSQIVTSEEFSLSFAGDDSDSEPDGEEQNGDNEPSGEIPANQTEEIQNTVTSKTMVTVS